MKWYKKAADAGNANAMNNIGIMYNNGAGITQDYKNAMKWYKKAADAGNANAMNNIGIMYKNGEGVTRDYKNAMKWYKKAANIGNDNAMNNIGIMYNNGEGVTRDYKNAMKWYKKAADAGNVYAMNNIGRMYHHGYGVPQDYDEARRWYKAALDKDKNNQTAINELAKLPPDKELQEMIIKNLKNTRFSDNGASLGELADNTLKQAKWKYERKDLNGFEVISLKGYYETVLHGVAKIKVYFYVKWSDKRGQYWPIQVFHTINDEFRPNAGFPTWMEYELDL